MMGWLSDWWGGSGGTAIVEPAGLRDAARLAQLHGASFHRGWGEGEFEVMLRERNTLVHRLGSGAR
jgi:ribosomal-protein-alanine N-acetyltransferase